MCFTVCHTLLSHLVTFLLVLFDFCFESLPAMPEDTFPNRLDDAALPAESHQTAGGDENTGEDDLPPVQPPSAGFIVQLFLVPGLIVLVVVGVWALFGKLASSEQNWQRLVEEVRQDNPHRRWRGATSLIQLLRADQEQGEQGDKLSSNPDVAQALAGMLAEELDSRSSKPEDLKKREFLARGLRLLDVPDIVLPVLQRAMTSHANDPAHNDVRKNAVASIAVIIGRADEKDRKAEGTLPGLHLKEIIQSPGFMDDLLSVSRDRESLMRHVAAYTLGLIPTQPARQRLEVMLEDTDEKTRINAAIGLARQNSRKGLPVFKTVLQQAADEQAVGTLTVERRTSRYFWIGVAAFVLLISAVWAFGTTYTGRRIVSASIALVALTMMCWGIYDLVQNPTYRAAPDSNEPEITSQEFASERQAARNRRFERLVSLQNTLTALRQLNGHLTTPQRQELIALIEPIADEHPEPRIRIDASRTLRLLRAEET